MLIQINSDDNIDHAEVPSERIEAKVRDVLERFADQLTRIEIHLSDENSDKKGGAANMRCLMAARPEGLQPLAVTDAAASLEQAVEGAVGKMKRSLESTLGKRQNR